MEPSFGTILGREASLQVRDAKSWDREIGVDSLFFQIQPSGSEAALPRIILKVHSHSGCYGV